MSHTRLLAISVAAALAFGACTSSEPEPEPSTESLFTETDEPTPSPTATDTPTPEPSATPSETETAAGVDITTVPEEITLEYVTAVVNELFRVYTEEALVPVLSQDENPLGAIPEQSSAAVGAVFTSEAEARFLDELAGYASGALDRSSLFDTEEIGPIVVQPVQLSFAGPECIIAIGRLDRSALTTAAGVADSLSAISLSRSADGGGTNRTPWVLVDTQRNTGPDGPNPDDVMLETTLESLSQVLDNTCTEGDARD